MLEMLVLMRDVLIAVVLSWMGLSELPEQDAKKDGIAAPTSSISLLN